MLKIMMQKFFFEKNRYIHSIEFFFGGGGGIKDTWY